MFRPKANPWHVKFGDEYDLSKQYSQLLYTKANRQCLANVKTKKFKDNSSLTKEKLYSFVFICNIGQLLLNF